MSPSSADVAQTPEPKSTSGLASVFKSLTGSKSTRSPHPQSPVPSLTSQFGAHSLKKAIYGGPPNYEQLHEQLKAGNPLSERLAAAESLRHAVQDYPLSGVTSIFKEGKDLIEPSKPLEARVAGYELLTACVQKSTSTDPERMLYFRVLTADAHPEDFHLQLAAIVELAKHGRDLSGFHYQAIPLLTAWLRQAFTITSAARKKASKVNRSQKIPLGEETNLSLLFVFIVDVIKFSFNIAEDGDTSDLMDAILYICVHTPLSSDLKACINVIDAIITYGEIPNDKLLECVKVLCSIHCLVADARSEAWRSISNLAKSHNGQITVRYLLDILRNPSTHGDNEKQTIREIRGAMSVLEKLFAKDGQNGYPLVPFTLLMDALTKAVAVEHAKVEADILHLILSLLNGDGEEVMENVIEEDWFVMFDVVLKCSRRTRENSKGRSLNNRSRILSPLTNEGTSDETFSSSVAQTLETLIIRIEQLLQASSGKEFFQRDDCITFFVSVHPFLTESCAKLVIDYYMEYRLCYPSDLEWRDNIKLIMGAFFSDRTQPAHIRLHSLQAVTDVYEVVELMDEPEDPDCVQTLVTLILEDIGDEKDIAVLQELVYFAVSVAEKAEESLFSYIVNAFRRTVTSDRLQSPLGSPQGSRQGIMGTNRPSSSIASNSLAQTPSNVVTKGLVHIFMKTMDSSASKSIRIFDELLWIAKSHECETDARISALKMLFRLRADWANRLFLTPFTESDGLAASLFRTPPSLARKQAADEAAQQQHRSSRVDDMSGSRISRSTSFGGQGYPQGRAPFRTGTGVSRIVQKNHQMWMSPDPDALPEPASNKASSLLCSFAGADEDYPDGLITLTRIPLNIALFLETIIALLQHGCDWEIYSYILVHLASQLTNKALFKAAMPQIKELRVLLCDQIKNSSYHEPPLSSGLRKADVAICMFQILTMIISYHDVFTKAEDDEIVRTFLQGVGADRAAKCCVHALSICCHELPASTSKALVNILQRMSSIITQSHVAVHILEFLACLARLPNLYVNFREDEYKTILMMCFRYLQYVRDQPTKEPGARNSAQARNSGVSMDGLNNLVDLSAAESNFQPNTSDDLPQYVHALAYHVIIFWFLSLRLPDRAGLVGWITKNLISTDVNGKEMIDEQAQVTLDFMQRVAYADVDESAADPTFTEERFGEILKKRWIVGQSIVTVEQATKGGWAQITKRQPSGTSCYIIREKFTRPPAHQDQLPANSDINVVFPSHLLLQLTASMPQSNEASRPIPLPNDAQMTRAIATFDRNFTVDGHKVGVIYIGANQTQEVEILSNVMGSSDYTHFLSGLGTLTKLKGANFNTQGLDRYSDSDGEYAFCWRDRVTEIVFHVTTQMPTNLSNDPQCIGKKRHIGNDFVNIIFNNSGLPFRYDTFPSEFNYVNIVITPESRASFVATRLRSEAQMKNAFYKVQVMSKPGFPEISPASETKMVGLEALPGFIRLLALNASVFSLVWANREGGEHISSWRNRLREIKRLREKYGPKKPNSNPTSPVAPTIYDTKTIRDSLNGLRRSSVANFLINPTESTSQRSSIFSTAETEVGAVGAEESLVDGLDFSKWA
ncbi:hypothetical protein B0O99DRAFT_506748 [Bisporella sp. PMI_857]|nr:hypothetical protein B0O99DRAFT_506748 [Bisporella sp. PMI_857]